MVVVIVQPESKLAPGAAKGEEHLHVQALAAQSSVEALDLAVFDRPPWPDEVHMHSVRVRRSDPLLYWRTRFRYRQ
jgi:hypothetical protein